MLLFQKRFHAGLVDGTVTRTFRLWDKPRVKPGGRYRVHPIGVVEVEALARRTLGELTDRDARAGGFTSRAELLAYMAPVAKAPLTDATPVFDVTLKHGGDGDRVSLALEDQLTPADVDTITKKLARLDGDAPWTRKVLGLIGRRPRVAASKLAASLGRETAPFKVDVRKLKKLGLTQSFEVGYEISPRGRAFLAAKARKARGTR
ncbi:MAG: hypothetical protein SFW67_14165 [Myxococcaceae bacterium]|nr:hypothetical protein [Myxococcaceae bacterium]